MNFSFADHLLSIDFAARGRSICTARLGSLVCMEQGITSKRLAPAMTLLDVCNIPPKDRLGQSFFMI